MAETWTGIDRLASAVESAVNAKAPACADWHATVSDVLAELEEAVRHADDGRSADAAMHARLAIGSLAGIWLGDDEKDAIYLDEPAATPVQPASQTVTEEH